MTPKGTPINAGKYFATKNTEIKRSDLHDQFGGIRYTGISYSALVTSAPIISPNIFLFSDPKQGAKFGYDKYDGEQPDGSYLYTGEGQSGDQVFTRGNKAIREASKEGRYIHVFEVKSSKAKYKGEFVYDSASFRETLGKDGKQRLAIVFRLLPVDQILKTPSSENAETISVNLSGEIPDEEWKNRVRSMPFVPRSGKRYSVASPAWKVDQERDPAEARLEEKFSQWWKDQGQEVQDLRIILEDDTILEPDLFIPGINMVVEAKASTSRSMIRMALGQILDYAFLLNQNQEFLATLATTDDIIPAILLPTEPKKELLDLLHHHHLVVYWESDFGDGFIESKNSL